MSATNAMSSMVDLRRLRNRRIARPTAALVGGLVVQPARGAFLVEYFLLHQPAQP
jgi:hypothetical protein